MHGIISYFMIILEICVVYNEISPLIGTERSCKMLKNIQ